MNRITTILFAFCFVAFAQEQTHTQTKAEEVDQLKIQVQETIQASIENLPEDVQKKLQEAKKTCEAQGELTKNMNSVERDAYIKQVRDQLTSKTMEQISILLCDLNEETRKQVEAQIKTIQSSCEKKEIKFKEITQNQTKSQTGK